MSVECQTQVLKIERPLYDQDGLQQAMDYQKPKEKFYRKLNCRKCKPLKFLRRSIPILQWLPKYKWREDLVNDLVAGFTVAIMHIPQGMAYALLGNVEPIIGIYMAFFPVLVYFILGTSRHNSMGTFAIVCLMMGKVITDRTGDESPYVLTNSTESADPITKYSSVEVATAVTFVVGISQLVMYIFRLGIVTTLLSETLVNGFTTGCAIHVLVSQIKDLFGLKIPRQKGAFEVIFTVASLVTEIPHANVTATIISAVTITVCVINNELLKPRVSKVSSFPIPIELIVVVTGTLVSNHWDLEKVYHITTVGNIPSGLPAPQLPNFSLLSSVVVDALVISIVAYTIALSMALIFAQKFNYEVDANQELLAQGTGNLFGSFFLCMPFSASLSRSLIQQTVGGKTQLTSLVSCFILLFVLLWIGPFFEPLPKSVLASVIVVALKGMLMQVTALKRFWNLSKLDGLVWIITFLSVVILNVDIGLLVGFVVSLLSVMILGMKPYTCLLGSVPNTDLYVDVTRYKKAKELPNIKIFHYCGGVNFATKNYFKNELYRLTINPQKEAARRAKQLKKNRTVEGIDNIAYDGSVYSIEDKVTTVSATSIHFVIVDFSSLSSIDPSSITMMKSVAEDFRKINVAFFVAGCSSPVYEKMVKCELTKGDALKIFPTVHDAVQSTITTVDITAL